MFGDDARIGGQDATGVRGQGQSAAGRLHVDAQQLYADQRYRLFAASQQRPHARHRRSARPGRRLLLRQQLGRRLHALPDQRRRSFSFTYFSPGPAFICIYRIYKIYRS